jgi:hypothetical protein
MITKKMETKTYIEHLYCECGGEMEHTPYSGGIYIDDRASYIDGIERHYYVCNKCCSAEWVEGKPYPRVIYDEIE